MEKTPPLGNTVGSIARHLPNAITLLNLFCGCCAVIYVFYGYYVPAFWFFAAAIAADYFDGMVARLLQVHSPLGRELDSLADVVSFGLLPGSIFYMLLVQGWTGTIPYPGLYWAATPAFAVTLFSALRLAKFNLDTRQAAYFIGLPTPSSALFAVGLMLMVHYDSYGLAAWMTSPFFLYPCIAVLSAVLVAELPMFNLKFKSFRWRGNEIRFIFAVVSILLLAGLREAAFSLIIFLYVILSVIFKLLRQPV